MSIPRAIVLLVFALSPSALASAADCTITLFSQVEDVISNCTDIVVKDLTVPGGESLELDLQTGSTLTFEGKILFEVSNWAGPLVSIKGSQLRVQGAAGHVLDGQGKQYWDGLGGSGSAKPSFFSISYVENSTFSGINILNCPINCVSVVSSNDVVLDGFTVDVSEGREKGVNTDGFGVTYCVDVVIKNSIVKNQDDCVVVNQGYNYTFQDLVCEGGHGLSFSVGFGNISIGQNTVQNVTFKDCTVLNSANGIHVKTHPNAGQGSITDVLYSNITLQGINNFGISIEQNYPGHGEEPRGNILIKNLVMESVTGSMAGSNSIAVEIICGLGGCEDWHWNHVDITGASNNDSCNYEPEGYAC
ncbi:polygalacturonase-like [Cylas formicarius]|uniref:polygalacturonase-like n=1 Tax=Cylas formicarius TaxID=197179 RepID=UPI002958673D|nr:polygalacturonase-like [Cylas formicarius]XP_060535943.1 polygalacturonase-like [Cylas formicarius]